MNDCKYLLDTNIISELRKVKQGRCNRGVADWVQSVKESELCTSAVVAMELERGVLGLARKDPLQAQGLRNWLDYFLQETLSEQILPLDATTAKLCASLHVPDRSPENDAWIAAQAIQHGLILVTRNEKDFADFAAVGLRLLNPFRD
ncbi:MAG: type II toxin-antitoxin system VapC family toxin [Moraxella sp.]|nr:type II toxin-antitoxin system VapC family toxin [Moraxella sp.]